MHYSGHQTKYMESLLIKLDTRFQRPYKRQLDVEIYFRMHESYKWRDIIKTLANSTTKVKYIFQYVFM